MNNRIALISKIDIQLPLQNSIANKYFDISKALKQLGFEATLFNISNGWFSSNSNKIEKISSINPINISFIDYCIKNVDGKMFNYVWVRHSIFSFNLLTFFKKLKKENPNITIMYEIPTYPYLYEYNVRFRLIIKLHEKIIMNRLSNYVDYILGGFDEKNLFNIPVLKLTNGINIDNKSTIFSQHQDESFNFIVSGLLWDWYGVDRIISGLYLSKRKDIKLHIFGNGNQLSFLKNLVEEYSLQDMVIFYGWVDKNEIDNLKLTNKIGVGTLAPFRKKLNSIYSIKHREFCALGIPFIYGGIDIDFDDSNCRFTYKVPLNNTPMEINDIVKWYKEIKLEPYEIRNFAIEHLDWKAKLKSIFNEIEK